MTIHVTVHHAHGDSGPQELGLEVLKPAKGKVVRNERDETGHVVEFEVAGNTRELVYQWWDAASAKPKEPESVTYPLRSDSDRQEFRWVPPEEEADTDEFGEESVGTGVAQNDAGQQDEISGVGEAQQQAADADLHGQVAKVTTQIGKTWGRLDDVIYRVEHLEQRLAAHMAEHPGASTASAQNPATTTTPIPVPTSTGLQAAALLAAADTVLVRDGFTAAGAAFAARLGVDPAAGGAGAAERTFQQVDLAAGAASSAIARYTALGGAASSSSPLVLAGFQAEVRAAGDDYAESVERIEEASRRTSDPGEVSAYAELLEALRADPTGPAVGRLRGFVVGQSGAGSSNRQGVTS